MGKTGACVQKLDDPLKSQVSAVAEMHPLQAAGRKRDIVAVVVLA